METDQSVLERPLDFIGDLVGSRDTDAPVLMSHDGLELTAGDLASAGEAVRSAMADAGIVAGHRLALVAAPGCATAIILLSLFERQTIMPLNPALSPVALRDTLETAGADHVVIAQDFLKALPAGADADLHTTGGFDLLGVSFVTLRREHVGQQDQGVFRGAGLVLHTSGTTGTPKRVPLRATQMLTSARTIARHLGLGPADRAVHCLPMFHVGAFVDLLLAPLLSGGSVVVTGTPDPEALRRAVINAGGTWLQLVPTMLSHCLAQYDDGTSAEIGARVRFIRMVSSDLPDALRQKAQTAFAGAPLVQMYGMTETAGQITSNPVAAADGPANSVGQASGPRVRLIDPQGAFVATGREGEVCVAGDTVMTGYEGDEPTPRHGEWFRTGDLGRFDEDGFLYLTGRSKEMINRGGEKVSPVVVERAAMQVAGIIEAAAFALPHPTLGEQVGLAVVRQAETAAGEDAILKQLRDTLAEHELPRRIIFMDALPRLPSGKVARNALAGEQQATGEAPVALGPVGEVVSALWQKVLSVPAPYVSDDFFDSGGDSLSATEFILQLEKALRRPLPPNLLFDAPRFGALVERIETLPAGKVAKEPPFLKFVRDKTAGWAGQRVGPRELVVARNTISEKLPVVLGVNGTDIADSFGVTVLGDHPLYMLRSLDRYHRRNAANAQALSEIYAEELDALIGDRFICGGFCSGADLTARVVDLLKAKGRQVAFFISIDHQFMHPTPYPVFHICSETDRFSPFARFVEPQRGFGYWHPEGCDVMQLQGNHVAAMTAENFDLVAPRLKPVLEGAVLPLPSVHGPVDIDARRSAYRARIRAAVPRRWRHGQLMSVPVEVQNTSSHTWRPTAESGLRLIAEFRNFDGVARLPKAATAPVPHEVPPGAHFKSSLELSYPDTDLPLRLCISMVDDGYAYFEEFGARAFNRIIWAWPRRSS